jgi:hypothetical protein
MFSYFFKGIPNPSRIERIESFKAPLAIIDRLRPYGRGSSLESLIISSIISALDHEIVAFNAKISSIDNNHDIMELSCKLLSIIGHEAGLFLGPEPRRLFNILSNLLNTQVERCKLLIEEQKKTFIFGIFDKKQANAEAATSLKTFSENEIFDKVLVKEIFKFM